MKNVEDIYPLSPMQEVMLLRAAHGHGDDTLLNQVRFEIEGPLDVPAFRSAWQDLTARHPVLRTGFVWEGLKRPMQVAHREIEVDIRERDMRASDGEEQAAALEDLARRDRQTGFDPRRAPLNRLTLARRAENAYTLLWSSHHLIFDRWCLGTLFDEFRACYLARRDGRAAALEPAPRFRDYIAWIERQDRALARRYWGGVLAGVLKPTPLSAAAVGNGDDAPSESSCAIAGADHAALREFTRRHGVTPGALLQTAWAFTINRLTGDQDVVFGVTVSGRPPDLPGVEAIVGSFVNNVPVRVRLSSESTLVALMRSVHRLHVERSAFDYLPLADMHALSDLPPTASLCDSLLVWLSPDTGVDIAGLEFTGHGGVPRSGYPLTLSIAENEATVTVTLAVDGRFETVAPVGEIVRTLSETTRALVAADPLATLAAFAGFRGTSVLRAVPVAPRLHEAPLPHDGTEAVTGRDDASPEVLQELLLGAWHTVLGERDIGPDDDFFSLGGDSIRAASLHHRIVAATRTSVPLLALFSEPTIRAMARVLHEGKWQKSAAFSTPIRSGGTAPPLFCIASPDVNTIGYGILARHLDAQRPVFVLQAPPDSASIRRLSPREIPALAGRYVDAMTAIQGSGPYYLLGMCDGAQLSVEVARHLEIRGARVAFLGIVNTFAYYTISSLIHVHQLRRRVQWYGRRAGEILASGLRDAAATLRTLAARTPGRSQLSGQTITRSAPELIEAVGPAERPEPAESYDDEWVHEFGRASGTPAEPPINSRITVFRVRRQPFWRIRDRGLGWSKHARAVTVVDLRERQHLDILREPGVREVAARLEALLVNATPDDI